MRLCVFGASLLCLLVVAAADEVEDVEALCNATGTSRVEYQFTSDVIPGEHIVTFRGYFPRSTRKNYVAAALRNAGVCDSCILLLCVGLN